MNRICVLIAGRDAELIEIIDKCYVDAKRLLSSHRERLETLATRLLEVEQLDRKQSLPLLGASPVGTVSSDRLGTKDALSPTKL